MEEFRKYCLLNALDDIGLTLQKDDKIGTFEGGQNGSQPWLYKKAG